MESPSKLRCALGAKCARDFGAEKMPINSLNGLCGQVARSLAELQIGMVLRQKIVSVLLHKLCTFFMINNAHIPFEMCVRKMSASERRPVCLRHWRARRVQFLD